MQRTFHAVRLAFTIAVLCAGSALAVPPVVTIEPALVPYTCEAQGQLLVTASDQLKGKDLSVDVLLGSNQLAMHCRIEAGARAIVPFSLGPLALGDNAVNCRLMCDGQQLVMPTVMVTKLAPKPNEVKIDHVTSSMVVDGYPFLPVGFYCQPVIGTLAEDESLYGFNVISPYWSITRVRTPDEMEQIRGQLDHCASVGMRVTYHLEQACMNLQGKQLEDAIRPEIEAFRDHPALLAWYIADEPELKNIGPDRVQAIYKIVKSLDPYHPVGVCINASDVIAKYSQAMDFVLCDPYPIPQSPIMGTADTIKNARNATASSKPVWGVPQVFGGGELWYREPTANEVRVMTYLEVIHGATGIQSFIRRPPMRNPGSLIVWSECRTVAMELSQLAPAILSRETPPSLTCSLPQVEAKTYLDRGMLYVIAVNTVNQPATMQLKIDGAYSGKASAIFERREVDTKDGVLSDMIDALGTRIYRIPVGPMPKDDIEPSPDNLVGNPSFEEIVSAGAVANCYRPIVVYPYASAVIDPFVARHGRQSVRMTVPGVDQSMGLIPILMKDPQTRTTELSTNPWPFWFKFVPGDQLRISIWAKAKKPGLILRFSDDCLSGFPKDFTLTTEWQRYETTATVSKARGYTMLSFNLMEKGVAWFDLFEVARIPKPATGAK